jgi:hypothetical protein
MFKVLVLACSLSVPTDCWEFHDTRGPYKTYDQCSSRAYEMGNNIMEMQGYDLKPKMFRCVKLKGQEL